MLEEFYPCDIMQSSTTEKATPNPENKSEGSGIEGLVKEVEKTSTANPDLNKKCEKTDLRRYHLYRLWNINAILIVVDPPEKPHKFDGKRDEFGDGPIEGMGL